MLTAAVIMAEGQQAKQEQTPWYNHTRVVVPLPPSSFSTAADPCGDPSVPWPEVLLLDKLLPNDYWEDPSKPRK